MRAFVVNKLNHPSKIELTKDAPEPKLVPDQVLVDIYSAGLNFFDVSTFFLDSPNPDLNGFVTDVPNFSFPRFCRPRGNTRINLSSRSSWVQSLPVSSRGTRPSLWVVRSNQETGYSDTVKVHTRIKSLLTPSSFCPSQGI
jgi:hypothetical protein